jgi:hypothetical protein
MLQTLKLNNKNRKKQRNQCLVGLTPELNTHSEKNHEGFIDHFNAPQIPKLIKLKVWKSNFKFFLWIRRRIQIRLDSFVAPVPQIILSRTPLSFSHPKKFGNKIEEHFVWIKETGGQNFNVCSTYWGYI